MARCRLVPGHGRWIIFRRDGLFAGWLPKGIGYVLAGYIGIKKRVKSISAIVQRSPNHHLSQHLARQQKSKNEMLGVCVYLFVL